MYALLLSGLGMQMLGNSRPASGAEHHLSHLWEMHVINSPVNALHGEKVSVGLLLCLQKYKTILEHMKSNDYTLSYPLNFEYPDDFEHELVKQHLGPSGLYDMVIEENKPNLLTTNVVNNFHKHRDQIICLLEELPDYSYIRQILELVKCPLSLGDIGLSEDIRILSLQLSPYIKRRLTMMRLCKIIRNN